MFNNLYLKIHSLTVNIMVKDRDQHNSQSSALHNKVFRHVTHDNLDIDQKQQQKNRLGQKSSNKT